jgi:transcriptional regulator with XRE-family HTH domain
MRYRTLRQYIKITGIKQGRLAFLLGVSEPTISLLLSGERRPSFELGLRIKALTGIPLEQSMAGKL